MSKPKKSKGRSHPAMTIHCDGTVTYKKTTAHGGDILSIHVDPCKNPTTADFEVSVICGGKDDYVVLLSSSRKRAKKSSR